MEEVPAMYSVIDTNPGIPALPGPEQVAKQLSQQASTAFQASNYPVAERLLRQGLAVLRSAEGLKLDSRGQAWILNDLGDVLAKEGRYAEAAQVWEQAYRRLERVLDPDRARTNNQARAELLALYLKTLVHVARKLVLCYQMIGDSESASSWRVQLCILTEGLT
jgi:tetratricopeptide (TPR) repeat protein